MEIARPRAVAIVQPQERPPAPAPVETPAPPDEPSGDATGAVGGVEGGTGKPDDVGTVAVAAPPPPPPPPPVAEAPPIFLPPSAGSVQRLSDINDPRFRPTLPPPLQRIGVTIWALFRICVSVEGQVTDVRVMKSADPTVDGGWVKTVRSWVYRPYLLNGHPVPFCHAARIEVRAQN